MIEAPAAADWRHAASGITVPATLEGMPRQRLLDLTNTEHDIVGSYESVDRALLGTIYIFSSALFDIPVWFDRIDTMVRARDLYRRPQPVTPAPIAFALAAASPPAGLRQTYRTGGGDYRATSAAIMPIGDRLVAVRLSAKAMDPAALDAMTERVARTIAGSLALTAAAPAALPVAACPSPLAFGNAKPVKPDMADVLLGAMSGMVAKDSEAGAAREPWCRDGSSATNYGVYRQSGPGYVIAFGDAGRRIDVMPSVTSQIDGKSRGQMLVSLTNVDGQQAMFGTFSALPRPQQVLGLIQASRPVSTRSTSGKQVTISLPGK